MAKIAQAEGFELHALTVDYGQRHKFELEAARRVAAALDVHEHLTVRIDLHYLQGSALTSEREVPKHRDTEAMATGIPVTYVPARNTLFLALALGLAEEREAANIFIGVNAVDYSGYPDCRTAFIKAFENVARLATKAGVENQLDFKIHTPLIDLSKADIIRRGMELGVDYGLTHSCYDPSTDGTSCGACDACLLRLQGFEEAGFTDPLPYVS